MRRALGREKDAADHFAEQLTELLGYFDSGAGARPEVHARPAEGLDIPAFVLATGAGADIAAEAGLPLVIGGLRGEEAMLAAVDRYRDRFQPSARATAPYVVVSGTVAVAETAAPRSSCWSPRPGRAPTRAPTGSFRRSPRCRRSWPGR